MLMTGDQLEEAKKLIKEKIKTDDKEERKLANTAIDVLFHCINCLTIIAGKR